MTEETITLTFCENAESHVGMKSVGKISDRGFTLEDLKIIQSCFPNSKSTIYHLNSLITENAEDAYLLVIKKGCNELVNSTLLLQEQCFIRDERDTKAFMKGRVVNKKARHNLLFGDIDQTADFENKVSTVINFNRLPGLEHVRNEFNDILNNKLGLDINLMCEGNYYYDNKKCYIGFHGDFERKLVIGIRLGGSFKLHFQWYHRFSKIGDIFTIELNHGDIYVFSEKAVGKDWKRSSICTLRHAAGELKNFDKK